MAEAHNALGELLANSGDLASAESQFRGALRVEPDLPAAVSNLAHALAAQGNLPEAAWYFERAVRRTPDDPDTRLNYAVTCAPSTVRRCTARDRSRSEAETQLWPGSPERRRNPDRKGRQCRRKSTPLQAAKDPDPEIRRKAAAALSH